ncbi:MAG: CHAT domain-containing protein [Nannocystis sp.]|nr:CHAT domain-containing protein [Nannocystis sp.]MBK7829344.1 CHAT domain-containing protein [Nannocystis sp.]
MPSRCTYAITVEKQSGAGWPVTVKITQEEMLPVQIAGVLTLALDELRADVAPRAYGERLGRALFCGGVRDAFIRALAGRVDPLHVLLTLEADELRPLAWEYLCGPLGEGDDFLGLDQRVAYSRFLTSGVTRQFRPLRRDRLRALVVVANPAGLADYRLQPFDARAALDAVTAALAMPIDILGNFPAARGPATLDALCEALTQDEYPILHVVAHGQFIATRSESVVYLENKEGHVEPCSQTKLSERLGVLLGAPALRLLRLMRERE